MDIKKINSILYDNKICDSFVARKELEELVEKTWNSTDPENKVYNSANEFPFKKIMQKVLDDSDLQIKRIMDSFSDLKDAKTYWFKLNFHNGNKLETIKLHVSSDNKIILRYIPTLGLIHRGFREWLFWAKENKTASEIMEVTNRTIEHRGRDSVIDLLLEQTDTRSSTYTLKIKGSESIVLSSTDGVFTGPFKETL